MSAYPPSTKPFTAEFWLAYAANVLVMTIVALFYRFGDLVNHLGGGDQMLGYVVATGSFCGVLSRIKLTNLVNRFNLHLVWLASVGAMIGGAALVAVVASRDEVGQLSPLLVLGRILFAAGASGGLGLPIAFVQKTTPPEHRGEAVGFVSGGVFVGMMLGSGLSELVFWLAGPAAARFPALFATATAAGLLGAACVLAIRERNAPLIYEALPAAPPKPDAAAAKKLPPRYALLALALATGYAFTFCTVYLTRFLAVKNLASGYLTFFVAYCAAAFALGYATKSWGKLVGHYRMALIGTFANIFGTLLFLVVSEPWHVIFPAILCGLGRSFANPALVGLAESAVPNQRTVRGTATNRIFLALDIGNFLAALTMGLLAHAFGFGATIGVTAALVLAAGAAFVAKEAKAGAGVNLQRRKDDFRSRRKSDFGDGQWQTAGARTTLVYVKKPSGIRLDGAWHQPPKTPGAARPRDEIVLMIHADGDDFCSPSILETLQNYYIEKGLPVLRVNTSGKGVINYYNVHTGAERYGTVYEVVGDCLEEIDTWFAWLKRQGYLHVTLVGHRLGAVKVLYYAAHGQDAAIVRRVVALSPPRLAHDALLAGDATGAFRADLATAQTLMADGSPDAYFDAKFPFPDLMSARSYLDKYGPDARYDMISFLPRVACKTLVLLGSLEEKDFVAARGLSKDLRALANRCPQLTVEVVAGTNQYYSNAREKAALAVDAWVSTRGQVDRETAA